MSEVEQLAQEQFNTFKTRLCEILCEIEEEHKSAFIQGYAKGETDEKFRTVQVVSKHFVDLEKENAELKDKLNNLSNVAAVRLANWQRYEKENTELKKRNGELAGQKASLQRWLGEAKIIIQDLLSNSDEYARQRAMDYLKEE